MSRRVFALRAAGRGVHRAHSLHHILERGLDFQLRVRLYGWGQHLGFNIREFLLHRLGLDFLGLSNNRLFFRLNDLLRWFLFKSLCVLVKYVIGQVVRLLRLFQSWRIRLLKGLRNRLLRLDFHSSGLLNHLLLLGLWFGRSND